MTNAKVDHHVHNNLDQSSDKNYQDSRSIRTKVVGSHSNCSVDRSLSILAIMTMMDRCPILHYLVAALTDEK